MTYTQSGNQYLIRLQTGEELIESLKTFCSEHNITGAVTGLGASSDIELAYYDPEIREYVPKAFNETLYEVTNFTGNVSAEFAHVHMTIADREYRAYGGHCMKAITGPTLEINLTVTGEFIRIEEDPGSNLKLLTFN